MAVTPAQETPLVGESAPCAVRLLNLTKAYPTGETEVRAVDGVSLEVRRGERVAIVGRSGSGKSTLLNLIAGLETATSGEVWVGERNLAVLSDDELTRYRRAHIGVVYQFFNLLPTLSVRENVVLPALLAGRNEREMMARTEELLARVSMSHRLEARPHTLSGGERQRTALARALLQRPGLLLADEPTGNLDTRSAEQVLDLIYGLAGEEGATVILVTHSTEATQRADRILGMHDGRLGPEA